MPIAALPKYLGTDFSEASPGLRFGLLLPIWTSREDQEAEVKKRAEARSREGQAIKEMLQREGMDAVIQCLRDEDCYRQHGLKLLPGRWDKNDFAARHAWEAISTLTPSDRERMKHLALRQIALAATLPAESRLCLEATAIAPFTTGLGNEHPLENGFAFLWPYGLPYLPGSGVKGVLRQAARELASGQWGETHGWSEERIYPLMQGEGDRRKPVLDKDKRPVKLSVIDVLFGLESGDGDSEHVRGALSFWDVIPQIEGNSLMVEIMTPHQSHYYQKREHRAGNSESPHDSGQPNPIVFLTVPPKSRFTFHVVCDRAHLTRLAPDLIASGPADGKPRWQALLRAAFEHAFNWLGFGAKTAVGYGAMRLANPEENVKVSPYAIVFEESSPPAKPTLSQAQGSEETWPQATLRWDPGRGAVLAECQGQKTSLVSGHQSQALLAQLGEERKARLIKKKSLAGVKVKVRRQGNLIELLEIVT